MADLDNLPKVLCIVVSWTRFIGIAQRTYELCTSPKDKDCRQISPKEAKSIIAERGLIKVLETRDGCVYDTPNGDFLEKYQGWYKLHK